MIRFQPRLVFLRLVVVLSAALCGCAVVMKEHYYAPGNEAAMKRPHLPEETFIYNNLAPDGVAFEREGVQFELSTSRSTKSSCLLFGPLLPVIPVFGLFGSENPDSMVLTLFVTPNGHAMMLHFDEVTLKSKSWSAPRTPVKLALWERHRLFSQYGDTYAMVDCKADSVSLPSEKYSSAMGRFQIRIYFGPRPHDREPFQLELGGITVNGSGVPPIDLEFVPRSGWSWQMAGP